MPGYLVADARELADLIRVVIERSGGSQVAAAAKIGINQGTVSRLLAAKRARLGERTIARLVRRLTDEERERLNRAVLAPQIRIRLAEYRAWLEGQLAPDMVGARRLTKGITHPSEPRQFNPGVVVGYHSVPGLIEILRNHPDYRDYFDRFARRLDGEWGGAFHERVARRELAFQWVVEPLLAGRATGGIEVGVEELHATGALGKYLKSALDAQWLLVKRQAAVHRIAASLAMRTPRHPAQLVHDVS